MMRSWDGQVTPKTVLGSLWICRRVDMIQGDEECWEKSWVTNDQS